MRRKWLGLVAAGWLAVAGNACNENAGRPPSVLLIVVDTLRADHVGRYGYERATTPHLDALAEQSSVYTRAYSHAPWTTPSVGALMTSRLPGDLGVTTERSVLGDEVVTLAERLRAAGYRTAAAVSHAYCSARWNFDQGFEEFDESGIRGHSGTSAPTVSDFAIDYLERAADASHSDEPFFLWLHYFDPHFAYLEHADHRFGGSGSYRGPVRPGAPFLGLLALMPQLTSPDIAEMVRLYDSEIAYTDAQIARVLEALRETGRFDDTLVIVTADHGEEFFDHGSIGHARTLYDEVLRVPLLVKWPAGRFGRSGPSGAIDTPVGLIDVVPSVLESAGLPLPRSVAGRPLPRRELEAAEARPIFAETRRTRMLRAAVVWPYKIVRDEVSGIAELYHLERDPGEQRDLAALEPVRVRELEAQLRDWRAKEKVVRAPALDIDDELRDPLDSLDPLGYVDGAPAKGETSD